MGDLAATMSGLDVGAGDVAAAFGGAQDPGQAGQPQQEPAQTPQQGQEPQQPAAPAPEQPVEPGQPTGQQGQEPQQAEPGQAQGQQPQEPQQGQEPQPEPQQQFNPSDYGFDSQEALADALDDLADAVDIAGDRATLLKIVKEYKAQGQRQAPQPGQEPGQPDQSDDFWDDLYSEPGQDGGTPPEPGSIEAENRMLKQRLAQLESATRTREQEAAQMERYEAIADATLDRIGIADDNAREVFKMFVGIDNPVEEVDLGSRASIRKAVTGAATRLQEFIQGIKKAAVEEYVAGKAGMIPGTQGGQSGQGSGQAQSAQQVNGQRQQAQQPGQQTPTATQNPPQNTLTRELSGDQALIEDAFSKANSELLEVMVSAVNTE